MTAEKPDSEEAIIAEFWAPLAAGFPGAFGLEDDCAAIAPEPGCDLVVTTDAVIAGVHFFPGPADADGGGRGPSRARAGGRLGSACLA